MTTLDTEHHPLSTTHPISLDFVPTELVPLELIAPCEPENEINVDNPPEFGTLNQVFHVLPPVPGSKGQEGYNPNFISMKKFKHKGEPSSTPFILDPDFSSVDDSEDANLSWS